MKNIIKAFNNQPLINLKGRKYILNPLIDHIPETSYSLVSDVVKELSRLTNFEYINKIVGEEDRGGYIAAIMAYKHKKALAMTKWNPDGLECGHVIDFRNAYTKGKMYLHGVSEKDKIILIEDLVDSGGTLIAMIKLLGKVKVEIRDILVVAEKIDYNGRERVKKETGYDIKSLIKVGNNGGKSKVISTYLNK